MVSTFVEISQSSSLIEAKRKADDDYSHLVELRGKPFPDHFNTTLEEARFDRDDNVYRCPNCHWELEGSDATGYCTHCHERVIGVRAFSFNNDTDEEEDLDYDLNEEFDDGLDLDGFVVSDSEVDPPRRAYMEELLSSDSISLSDDDDSDSDSINITEERYHDASEPRPGNPNRPFGPPGNNSGFVLASALANNDSDSEITSVRRSRHMVTISDDETSSEEPERHSTAAGRSTSLPANNQPSSLAYSGGDPSLRFLPGNINHHNRAATGSTNAASGRASSIPAAMISGASAPNVHPSARSQRIGVPGVTGSSRQTVGAISSPGYPQGNPMYYQAASSSLFMPTPFAAPNNNPPSSTGQNQPHMYTRPPQATGPSYNYPLPMTSSVGAPQPGVYSSSRQPSVEPHAIPHAVDHSSQIQRSGGGSNSSSSSSGSNFSEMSTTSSDRPNGLGGLPYPALQSVHLWNQQSSGSDTETANTQSSSAVTAAAARTSNRNSTRNRAARRRQIVISDSEEEAGAPLPSNISQPVAASASASASSSSQGGSSSRSTIAPSTSGPSITSDGAFVPQALTFDSGGYLSLTEADLATRDGRRRQRVINFRNRNEGEYQPEEPEEDNGLDEDEEEEDAEEEVRGRGGRFRKIFGHRH